MSKPKVLFLDIETLPNICFAYDLYSPKKPNMIIKEKAIICFGYKWLGEKKTNVIAIDKPYEDKELVKQIIEIINEADYIVAHYGDKFDMRFIRARAIINGLKPPAPVPQIDTYKLVKKYFYFNANRLDYIGKILGHGGKMSMGWKFWERCANGDTKAIKRMARYNKRDVQLLEKVFLKILPYVDSKINNNLFAEKHDHVCPHCGSENVQKRGTIVTKAVKRQRFQCQNKGCYGWSSAKLK